MEFIGRMIRAEYEDIAELVRSMVTELIKAYYGGTMHFANLFPNEIVWHFKFTLSKGKKII